MLPTNIIGKGVNKIPQFIFEKGNVSKYILNLKEKHFVLPDGSTTDSINFMLIDFSKIKPCRLYSEFHRSIDYGLLYAYDVDRKTVFHLLIKGRSLDSGFGYSLQTQLLGKNPSDVVLSPTFDTATSKKNNKKYWFVSGFTSKEATEKDTENFNAIMEIVTNSKSVVLFSNQLLISYAQYNIIPDGVAIVNEYTEKKKGGASDLYEDVAKLVSEFYPTDEQLLQAFYACHTNYLQEVSDGD